MCAFRRCVASWREQEVGGPAIDATASEIRVGFLAETPDGDHTCPDNPETPITIQLEGPLGSRELVDAYDLGADLRDYL